MGARRWRTRDRVLIHAALERLLQEHAAGRAAAAHLRGGPAVECFVSGGGGFELFVYEGTKSSRMFNYFKYVWYG